MASKKPIKGRTAYQLFVQTCHEEHKQKHPGENVVFVAFSQKCAERWKVMSDEEKKPFKDAATQDKQRYEYEMKDYVPPNGTTNGQKKPQPKTPDAPKTPQSAFSCFAHGEWNKDKGRYKGVSDIGTVMAKLWAEADHDTKSKYKDMASRDKERYQREMEIYKREKKNGQPTPSS